MARDRLIAMRRAKALSQEDVAYRTGRSRTTVSRWEVGDMSPGPAARRALAQLYDCTLDELDEAIEATRDGEFPQVQNGWWSNYEAMEQSAVSVRTYEPLVFPGLLQTEAYARALLRDDELVARRLQRQAMLERATSPVELVAVIDESVMHRPIGGTVVLAAQLRHVLRMAELPKATVQVLPFTAPIQPTSWGAFLILGFPWPGGLVYLQHKGGARSLDSVHELNAHIEVFAELRDLALSPASSIGLIQRQLEDLNQ